MNDINVSKERLKAATSNAIGLSAGAELFTAFVSSFPHESTVSLTNQTYVRTGSCLRTLSRLSANLLEKAENMLLRVPPVARKLANMLLNS
jgi:hypothetical protein